ncbi:unnamed protein product [Phytophthora fragariaefolia]|uniref:Unnamed protein product n=1 Tax=Phytophthora fragariaefolia TaxID=1490495 RepID=A0A9W6XYJ6_9STRA|nr:unnamed protein product [Phytophthora fragariaefolia]
MDQEEGAATEVQVEVCDGGQKLLRRRGDGAEEAFQVGDAVVLLSRLTEQDFHGFVSAVTTDEVKLVLVCGTHVSVTLARLRTGQCTLEKQQPQAVMLIAKSEEGQNDSGANGSVPGATSLEELLRDPPDARRRAAVVMSAWLLLGFSVRVVGDLTLGCVCWHRSYQAKDNDRYPTRLLTVVLKTYFTVTAIANGASITFIKDERISTILLIYCIFFCSAGRSAPPASSGRKVLTNV